MTSEIKLLISLVRSKGVSCVTEEASYLFNCNWCSQQMNSYCESFDSKSKFDLAKQKLSEIEPGLLMEKLL